MLGTLTLTISAGSKAGKTFVFEEHDTLLFGRMHDCQVCLPPAILYLVSGVTNVDSVAEFSV